MSTTQAMTDFALAAETFATAAMALAQSMAVRDSKSATPADDGVSTGSAAGPVSSTTKPGKVATRATVSGKGKAKAGPTKADALAKLKEVLETKGHDQAVAFLNEYNAKTLDDIPAESYVEFIARGQEYVDFTDEEPPADDDGTNLFGSN